MSQPVTKIQLDNGLTVVLKEMHHAPVISWWVFYRVGSRNEIPGGTGLSHWCEHMMFKGTPTFPAGELDRIISRDGGIWNAFTGTDYTAYYETLPADRIDIALRLEADRMVNTLFDPEAVEVERTVIMSEREGAENQPGFRLREAMRGMCFRVHSYRHEVLGDMDDLATISRDALYDHYRRHYRPNNAVAVAVGHFETGALLARIRELYEPIPAGAPTPPVTRTEPEQHGARRFTVERPGTTAFVLIAVPAPTAAAADYFRLDILDSILAGSGGASTNKTSRLYRALVNTQLAATVSTNLSSTIDPYIYTLSATVNEGRTPAEVEAALVAEIDRLLQSPVSEAELEKAKKQAKAYFAYESERITDQAYWVGDSLMVVGDITWFDHYLDRLLDVTADEVLDVAQRYFKPARRNFGWFVPTP
ncbi:MAG: insulinase family protein [Anaerolineae bacterium]|nr:insulinase family protein [Anaerolineae bacterium]